jgi:iron complex transport system ATP-binding protein
VSVLQAQSVSFRYSGTPLLREISLAVRAGEVVGLIGPNGAGKTTLLKLMACLLRPESGRISWDQQQLETISEAERARLLAYLPQGAPAHWPLTVERLVELGRIPHRTWWQRLSPDDQSAVNEAMVRMDIARLRGRLVTTLSGGERARVMLARVFATRPRVILVDEPVASLDPFHQLQVMRALREHAAEGGSVLVVLHDLNLAARFCDRLLLLDCGAIACQGVAREVLENPALAAAYSVRIDTVEDANGLWVHYR